MPDEERAIDNYLNDILNARYGEQVRSAIYNSISRCYDDVQDGVTIAEATSEDIAASWSTYLNQTAPNELNTRIMDQFNTWGSSFNNWAASVGSWSKKFNENESGNWVTIFNEWTKKFNPLESGNWVSTFSGWDTSFTAWSKYFNENEAGNWVQIYKDMVLQEARAEAAADNLEQVIVTTETVMGSTPMAVTLDRTVSPWVLNFKLKRGEEGAAFIIKGDPFESLSDLQSEIDNPSIGDCYEVGSSSPYTVYRWTGTAWNDEGGISITSITDEILDEYWITNDTTSGAGNKYLNGRGLTYLLAAKLKPALESKANETTVAGSFTALGNRVSGVETSLNTSVVLKREGYDLMLETEQSRLASVIPSLSDPLMDGVASAGSSTSFSRADHRHPRDTNQLLYFTSQAVSAASNAQIALIEDPKITTDSVVLSCKFADEKYVLSAIDWASGAGSIAFTGTVTAATTMDVIVGLKGN